MPDPTYAKLTWDGTGERWYETGTKNGALYPMNSDGTYAQGVAWNGLTAVTESPEGAEPTDLWADDMKYASIRSAETFKFTIEAYTYPDEFMECDGSKAVTGVPGVYFGQQARKSFGFVYKSYMGNDTGSESDDAYKLHIIYGATASPSERAYSTINDSPDAITFSWECDTTPVTVEGHTEMKPVSEIIIDSRTADPTKLTALEKKLFGDGTTMSPSLPSPAQVITDMTPA